MIALKPGVTATVTRQPNRPYPGTITLLGQDDGDVAFCLQLSPKEMEALVALWKGEAKP